MDTRALSPEDRSSVTTILKKASECLEIAQTQRDAADQQHFNAGKLDEVGHALEDSAVEIQGKAIMDKGRGRA